MVKRHWLLRRIRRFAIHVTSSLHRPPHQALATSKPQEQTLKNLWNLSRIEHFLLWLRGQPRQHFGPRSRILDLFNRRDNIYYALSSQKLRWHLPRPPVYHDILDVGQKIGEIERTIGYVFKDRMICAEALKMSGPDIPLWFNGTVHPVGPNNRLALLGDRALSMSICGIWYRTGNSTKQYTDLGQDIVTRASLAIRGHKLGFHNSILINSSLPTARPNQIAEAFEAILGAVYVDSGNKLAAVTKVIRNIGLDEHALLRAPKATEIEGEQEEKEKAEQLDEEGVEQVLEQFEEEPDLESQSQPQPPLQSPSHSQSHHLPRSQSQSPEPKTGTRKQRCREKKRAQAQATEEAIEIIEAFKIRKVDSGKAAVAHDVRPAPAEAQLQVSGIQKAFQPIRRPLLGSSGKGDAKR